MATRLWRCVNPEHGKHDFEAGRPVCPECGAGEDGRSRARFILPLKVVHFDPPAFPGVGRNVKACDGKPWGEGVMATAAPSAVTCPACMETGEYKAALAAAENDPAYAVPDRPGKAARQPPPAGGDHPDLAPPPPKKKPPPAGG